MNRACIAFAVLAAARAAPVAAAPILGQSDTFQDGTTGGWQNGGSRNPNPAANVATGGPAGAGDRFLRVAANGLAGAGGKLVVFNQVQWAGNYVAANVTGLRMRLNNTGATALSMRLILENASAGQSLTSSAAVTVPAGGGWVTADFPLTVGTLTGGTFATVMTHVTELNLLHATAVIADRSAAPDIAAQIGVDNITAVPEPAGAAAAAVGLIGAAGMRRPRARTRRQLQAT